MRTPTAFRLVVVVVVVSVFLAGQTLLVAGKLDNIECMQSSNVLIIERLVPYELTKSQQEIWAKTTASHCVSYYQEVYHDSTSGLFPWINEVEVYFKEQELHRVLGWIQLRIVYDHNIILYSDNDDDSYSTSSSCDVIYQNLEYYFGDPFLLGWDKYKRNLQSALQSDKWSADIKFVSLDIIGTDFGGFYKELKTKSPTWDATKPPRSTPSLLADDDSSQRDDNNNRRLLPGVLVGIFFAVDTVVVAVVLRSVHIVSKRKVEATLCNVVGESSYALKNVPNELKNDKEFIKKAVSKNGLALEHAPTSMKNVKDIVFAAVGNNGLSLQHASDTLKADIDIVLAAVKQDGNSLRYASPSLRADKKCVMAAVSNKPESLQFALRGLNQDKDLLIAAGIWDKDHKQLHISSSDNTTGSSSPTTANTANTTVRKIVLSTRFSLDEDSNPTATKFTRLLKQHPFIENNFIIFSPNAFKKSTCDPEWTRFEWPCRGTFETCKMHYIYKSGTPTKKSCWRYSFRYHLEQAKQTNGFMIQVVELAGFSQGKYRHKLGKGQQIETEMAKQVGTKIFRVYEPPTLFRTMKDIQILIDAIEKWYNNNDENCAIMDDLILGKLI